MGFAAAAAGLGQSTGLSGVQHGGVLVGMLMGMLVGMLMAAAAGRRVGGRPTGSLRTWTVWGCIASAMAMAGLVAAGWVGPAWPFKANVLLLGVANGAFSIAAIGSMMALASHGAAGHEGVRMGLWGPASAATVSVRTRAVIGADGARSLVAQQSIPEALSRSSVFACHAIIATPDTLPAGCDASRCAVVYRGSLSPDFYGWVFPHGKTLSIGTGSADKGFSQRSAVAALRVSAGLGAARSVRREGAPLPMKPLPRWDNGRDVVLAGDAAGVVAPASGEGICCAMVSGQHAATAVQALLAGAAPSCLKQARKQFMRQHGRVFPVLGVMQRFCYRSDKRRERFVAICRDKDVQQITFDAYMNKRLVRSKPMAHVRIFLKDMAPVLGLARV